MHELVKKKIRKKKIGDSGCFYTRYVTATVKNGEKLRYVLHIHSENVQPKSKSHLTACCG